MLLSKKKIEDFMVDRSNPATNTVRHSFIISSHATSFKDALMGKNKH